MISVHQLTAIRRHSRHAPLGSRLGNGGKNGSLNPPHQIGGPRSAQLALNLLF
jgi:hypothetical protein